MSTFGRVRLNSRLYPTNPTTLPRALRGTGSLRPSWRSFSWLINPPATPKIAPDAPALTTIGCTSMLATLAPRPLTRYSRRNAARPNNGSASAPSAHRHHMLSARWTIPKWRNVEVKSRHGWAVRVRGPKSAPQRSNSPADGSMTETPSSAVARKATTLRPTRLRVMIGRGVIAWSARLERRPDHTASRAVSIGRLVLETTLCAVPLSNG